LKSKAMLYHSKLLFFSGSSNKKSLGSRPRNQCYAKFIPPSNKDSGYENGGTVVSKVL